MADANRALGKFRQRLEDYQDLVAFSERAVEYGSIDNAFQEADQQLKITRGKIEEEQKQIEILQKQGDTLRAANDQVIARNEAALQATREEAAGIIADAHRQAREIELETNKKATDAIAAAKEEAANLVAAAKSTVAEDQVLADEAKARMVQVNADIAAGDERLAQIRSQIADARASIMKITEV